MRSYERHFVGWIVGLCVGMTLYSWHEYKYVNLNATKIKIHVVGAVEKEECVEVVQGTSIAQILQKINMALEADTQAISIRKRLQHDSTLVIPYRNTVTLYITGEVGIAKILTFNHQPKVAEILTQIEVTNKTDIRRFKRRRKFLNGSVVEVPKKQ